MDTTKRIAIISARSLRGFLTETFEAHPEFGGRIACFVNWGLSDSTDFRGIPIIPLDELKKQRFDIILLAVKRRQRLTRLITWLHDEGIPNVYLLRPYPMYTRDNFIIGSEFHPRYVAKLPSWNEKPWLMYLETHVCDNCNLNCRACNHFSPFVQKKTVTEIRQFDRDMSTLSGLFSNIDKLNLLGGEPLLAPETCCEMIKTARTYFPKAELCVSSNAMLVPSMDREFWDILRENDVYVQITIYPPMREKMDTVLDILSMHSILHYVLWEGNAFSKRLRLHDDNNAEYNNENCTSGGCHFLKNGRITKCPDAMLYPNMSGTALSCVTSDAIRLTELSDAWELIRKLDEPCELCRWCSLQSGEMIPWSTCGTNPDPKDWIISTDVLPDDRQIFSEMTE